MEFYLVKEKLVVFKNPPTKSEAGFSERETSVKACLQLMETHQDEQSKRDFEILKNLVESNAFGDYNSLKCVNAQERKCLPSRNQKDPGNEQKL